MPNVFAELMRFDDLCRQIGDQADLTDSETIDALLEGETELIEICQAVLDDIDELEILQKGLADKIKEMNDRKASFDRQAERAKDILFKVMERHPEKTLRLATATLTMKAGADRLVITDESLIPFDLMNSGDPKPDKAAILKDLKAGVKVPGAEKRNGPPSLQIRRK